jgi:hypothetical protein
MTVSEGSWINGNWWQRLNYWRGRWAIGEHRLGRDGSRMRMRVLGLLELVELEEEESGVCRRGY